MFQEYWPYLLAVLSTLAAVTGVVHVLMTKEDVRSAIGWSAVILLSPLVGIAVYAVAGINRIRRASVRLRRARVDHHGRPNLARFDVSHTLVARQFGRSFAAQKTLGDRVACFPMTSGNRIEILDGGDKTYATMLSAIKDATRSVLMETYIFDADHIGLRLADALAGARDRGVEVRVLVDAVGERYSRPPISRALRKAGISVALFNKGSILLPRWQYANLRTHRKVLVVDGAEAFIGGMNIRQQFTEEFAAGNRSRDTHFRVSGPVVADIFAVAADDWSFATDEVLDDSAWDIAPLPPSALPAPSFARLVASGPDVSIETNHRMLMGAFASATHSIRILSPYFLPDREFAASLATAARRGVEVDIVIPGQSNLALIDRAMNAQLEPLLRDYCRIWRASGSFDHSKLLVVDSQWAFVGSSNLDSRSLRLNFEIDLEVLDSDFAGRIIKRIDATLRDAQPVTVKELRAKPFLTRLTDRLVWLASPYL